jgi:hypothetical protein
MREKMERELREKIEREVRQKTQRKQEKSEKELRERVLSEQELREKIEKEMREKIEREVREKAQIEQEKSEKELRERVLSEQELREKIEKEMREEIEREVRKKVQVEKETKKILEKETRERLEPSLLTENSVPIIKCDFKSDQSNDILTRPTFSGSDATPYNPTEACQLSPSSSQDSSPGSSKEIPRNNSRESPHNQYKLKTKNFAKSDSINDFVQQHSHQRLKTKKEDKNEKDIVSTEDRSSGGSPRRPSVPSPSALPPIAKDSSISVTNSNKRSTATLEVSTSSSNVPSRPSSLPPVRPHAVSLGKSNMTTSSPRNEFDDESTTTPTTTTPTKPPVRPHSSPPSRPLLHLPPLDDTPISTTPTKINLLPKAISTIGSMFYFSILILYLLTSGI